MAVTIKDVAKQAGVSTATVSKVMNGSYSISQETIDRVKKVMQELDYHPNLRARNFVTQSTKTIVFVTSLGKNAGFANPHMFEMVCGMEHVLTEKGYSLVIKNMSSVEARDYIHKAAEEKAADGYIIHAAVISKELDEMIFQESIPHLVIGNPNFTSHFCWSRAVSPLRLLAERKRIRFPCTVWTACCRF